MLKIVFIDWNNTGMTQFRICIQRTEYKWHITLTNTNIKIKINQPTINNYGWYKT